MAGRWPLVGRSEELSLVGRLLSSPGAGGLVIAGAAGTGKSRLAAESLAVAQQRRLPVARVVASRAAATIPLGAFAPLLPHPETVAGESVDALRRAADRLATRARPRRLVLLVDDAHELDAVSATLLHQVVLAGTVFVFATVRSGQEAPDPVVALWKDGLAPRLELQALSREETVRLLVAALGGQVDDLSAHRLWAASGGNPLFLRELLAGAARAGTLLQDSGVWALHGALQAPASVRELVHQRLSGLPPALLTTSSTLAFGDAIGLALLGKLHPDADFAELEGRGLIQVDDDGRRRPVQLAHPMYGEVLRADAPRTRAATVARTLAERLEELGARRREDPLRVATWRLLTGGQTRPGLLALAGRQAYFAADYGLAGRLARAAALAGPDPEAALLSAQLLDEDGRHDDAEAALAGLDGTALPVPLRVQAALLRSDNLFFGLGRQQQALAVLLETEATMDAGAAGEVRANRAWLQLHAGRPRVALDTLADFPSGDVPGRSDAAVVTAMALATLGQTAAALRAVDAAAPPHAGYPAVSRDRDFPELARGFALLHAGALGDAEQVARRGQRASVADRPSFLHAHWTHLVASVWLARGLVLSAAAAFAQAAAAQRRLAQPCLLRRELVGQVMAAAAAGSADTADAAMNELDRLTPAGDAAGADLLHARAWGALVHGDRSAALDWLEQAARHAADAELVMLEVAVRHDLVRLGVHSQVARLTELAAGTDSAAAQACADHAAAAAAGSAPQLGDVAGQFASQGASLLAAETYLAAAAVADPRPAQGYARAADALIAQCEGARTPGLLAHSPNAPLTPRELEVVTKAADGMSSRDIAADLVVSVRTVNNLLQRAYDKLGVHTRRDAAGALLTASTAPHPRHRHEAADVEAFRRPSPEPL